MKIFTKIFGESIAQAWGQLTGNKLRSFLSLLGITIGIFCIIGVQSAVDSMQASVEDSFEKLGDDVIYIQKFPWAEDPGKSWWKYFRRPNPNYKDFEFIKSKVNSAKYADFHTFVGSKSGKFESNSVEGVFVIAATFDHSDLFSLDYQKGRYYTKTEYDLALNQVIIGNKIAEELFGAINPIGRKMKIMGRYLEVVGVIEKSGDSLIDILDYDETAIISYPLAIKMGQIKSNNFWGGTVAVKAKDESSAEELAGDLTFALRAARRLKPAEDDNFALNQLSVITNALGSVFSVFDLLGLVIGMFAILVGGFSVANIMFVSVRERTGIIGVKKALGAKQWIILLEFLIESILLCIIGGVFGLLLVYLAALALTNVMPFPIELAPSNVSSGMIWSIAIGLLAGFLPAFQAARMDPVEAIRA